MWGGGGAGTGFGEALLTLKTSLITLRGVFTCIPWGSRWGADDLPRKLGWTKSKSEKVVDWDSGEDVCPRLRRGVGADWAGV